jgi:hypothetical protein
MSDTPKREVHQRPALDFLAELRRGRFAAELTEALHEATTAATDTGKKAEVTVKILIDPEKVGDFETPRIKVSDSIGLKKPRRNVTPSTFFLTDDGAPVRTDPNQETFTGLRDVSGVLTAADLDNATSSDKKAN